MKEYGDKYRSNYEEDSSNLDISNSDNQQSDVTVTSDNLEVIINQEDSYTDINAFNSLSTMGHDNNSNRLISGENQNFITKLAKVR